MKRNKRWSDDWKDYYEIERKPRWHIRKWPSHPRYIDWLVNTSRDVLATSTAIGREIAIAMKEVR